MQLGPAPTLRLQPAVQLFQAGEAEPRLEEAPADHVDLVLDLALLPARRGRAGGRLDHVVVGHDQEAPVEHSLLADEHCIHSRLHVVVDAPGGRAAEEGEGSGMGVEHHLLALARVGPHVHRPGRAEPHVGDLHPQGRAGDLHVLMAPVELEGLARTKHQRHEGQSGVGHALAPLARPAERIPAHRGVGAVVAIPHQQVPDAGQPQPIAPRPRLVLLQQFIQALLERPNLGQGLDVALVGEGALRRADRLANHLPRQLQVPCNRLDRLACSVLTPDPYDSLHHQHPDLDRRHKAERSGLTWRNERVPLGCTSPR